MALIYFTLLLFFSLASLSLSVDHQFESCAPFSCGNGPYIRYPFRVSKSQETYCGYPNFDISCNDDRYPVLKISYDEYIIKDIFYSSQSFLLASASVYDEDESCPVPLHNVTLDRTPFHISPGYINFSFFYNCSFKPEYVPYRISCASNDSEFSLAAFHVEELELFNYSLNSCLHYVNAPLHTYGDFENGLLKKNYSEILKTGFVLNWTAPNCSNCEESGGRCGFENNTFLCFCHDKPHLHSCNDGRQRNIKAKAAIAVGVCAGTAILMLIGFVIYQRRKKKGLDAPPSYISQSKSFESEFSSRSDVEKGANQFGIRLFTYEELEQATNNFDSEKELGEGGFGTVYYGKLKDGRTVAVKRLYENNYKRVEQFMNEVSILARLRHQNLVSLYGCTSRNSRELLLVYEFISNGTVADHLHGEKVKPGGLPWSTRIKIAVETASALTYLHASEIIHRDVKTNNILLDNNFVVKVGDFGLSRLFPTLVTHISTAPQGTPGYVDPEYHECYQLTDKSDVYSFGVVLIELISSMPAVDITRHRHEINLSNMAINKIQSGTLHELVDPNLGYDSDYAVRKMINAVAELAFQCLQSVKELRPSMEEVLQTLKAIQAKDYASEKAEEEGRSSDVELLKGGHLPPSPDTVMFQWNSSTTTPNTSG